MACTLTGVTLASVAQLKRKRHLKYRTETLSMSMTSFPHPPTPSLSIFTIHRIVDTRPPSHLAPRSRLVATSCNSYTWLTVLLPHLSYRSTEHSHHPPLSPTLLPDARESYCFHKFNLLYTMLE